LRFILPFFDFHMYVRLVHHYIQSFLVENLLDPAHVDISHDRTSGGGKRENARPYEMHIDHDSMSAQGFTGRHRQDANKNFTEFIFEAPGTLRQNTEIALPNGKGMLRFGTALHCMPLGLGRSRLLFRVYSQGLPPIPTFILKNKPIWMRHLNSCLVLEQDVGLIATQEDHLARKQQRQHQSGLGVKDDYLLIKSSDAHGFKDWHPLPVSHSVMSMACPSCHQD
jgi:phenylpropionate dioxygenase-like ring-hydroxylating dioxygenase large terminal subunit